MEQEKQNMQEQEQEKAQEQKEKTFTQEQVTAIAAREGKRAVEALLKDAGLSPDGDYKEALKAFKQWQDGQKSDLERAQAAISDAEKTREEAEKRAALLERQLKVMKAGIPAEKTDRYERLAASYMDEQTDFDTALTKALKDFPVQNAVVAVSGGNTP